MGGGSEAGDRERCEEGTLETGGRRGMLWGPRDLEDHIESGHCVWSPATEVPHCQQGLGTKLLPITGYQEVGPLFLPPSLAPASLSLGAGAASQPNPKPSSPLFRAGNERRGSERSPQTR